MFKNIGFNNWKKANNFLNCVLIKFSHIIFLLHLKKRILFLVSHIKMNDKKSTMYNKHHLTCMDEWNAYMSTKTTKSIL